MQDWDLYEQMLFHICYGDTGLRIAPEERPFLVAGTTEVGKVQAEKICQILFETFNVPAMNECHSNILSLYASGRTCGTVVDVGEGLQQTMAIFSGYAIRRSARKQELGGEDVTRHLLQSFRLRGLDFSQDDLRDYFVVKKIKETHCSSVSLNPLYNETVGPELTDCILPDGRRIKITKDERLWCQEILFQPFVADKCKHFIPLPELVHDTIMAADMDLRKDLFGNIVLSGGATLPEGFADRVTKEVTAIAQPTMKVKVIAPPERLYSPWIGGSILASLSNHIGTGWICKDEYDESGPAMVHRMSFRI